jgi:hypothetical protein
MRDRKKEVTTIRRKTVIYLVEGVWEMQQPLM